MNPCHLIPRSQAPSRGDRLSLVKRLAVLALAIAVPAMAASDGFDSLSDKAAMTALARHDPAPTQTMPFEQPGMNFPGSAFYYLDDPPLDGMIALPDTDPLGSGLEDRDQYGSIIDSGPAARSFGLRGGPIDTMRALECLAQAVWYEAGSESEAGQRAVAQVVLNRVAHPAWPSSVCGVVYQGAQRSTGCQFTFTCDGSLRQIAGGESWKRARTIASRALHGAVYAPVGHATHYHTHWVAPRWAGSLDTVGTIGAHRFYRLRGKAGTASAFTVRHSGAEPLAHDLWAPGASISASRSAVTSPLPPAPDPRIERATAASLPALAPPSVSASEPAARSAIGQVKSEYSRAGQWKPRGQAGPPREGDQSAARIANPATEIQ